MSSKFSLIEAQVINQALTNVALETGIVLQRSAFSPNIRDIQDQERLFLHTPYSFPAQTNHNSHPQIFLSQLPTEPILRLFKKNPPPQGTGSLSLMNRLTGLDPKDNFS